MDHNSLFTHLYEMFMRDKAGKLEGCFLGYHVPVSCALGQLGQVSRENLFKSQVLIMMTMMTHCIIIATRVEECRLPQQLGLGYRCGPGTLFQTNC